MDGATLVFMSIYRPGSSRPSSVFFDELTGVLETLVMHACPVIIGGDFNIHVEDPSDPDAAHLSELFASFDIVQHVTGSTHHHGGTLDLIATFAGYNAEGVCVDPSDVISDHILVTCRLPVSNIAQVVSTCTVRSWRHVDRQSFRQAVRESAFGQLTSSLNADELFALYDSELRRIADRFAPQRTTHNRVQPLSPWYDAECRTIRRRCRRLEKLYRLTRSDTDRLAWVAAER